MKYFYPIAPVKKYGSSRTLSRAHKIYTHAIDFFVPIGTPVYAAADGMIIDIKSNSKQGGSARKFEKEENFIEIRHENDEYSYYGHLKYSGILVKIGQLVKAKQLIGYSGATGWLANIKEPHLHFMVGRYSYQTIPFKLQ